MDRKNKGFTLIELVVVIAIIAVIAGAVMLAINPAALAAKGRDAKRMQDMEVMVKAINLALAEGEMTLIATDTTACTNCSSSNGTQVLDGTGYVKYTIPSGKTGLSKYLATLPKDPTNTGTNVYRFASDLTGFELDVALESADNTAKMTTDGGNNAALLEMGTKLSVIN